MRTGKYDGELRNHYMLILHDGTLTRMEVGDRIAGIESRAARDIVNRRRVADKLACILRPSKSE